LTSQWANRKIECIFDNMGVSTLVVLSKIDYDF